MFTSTILIAALAASAFAQSSVSVTASVSTSIGQSMPAIATQAFNPALVNTTTRETWCANEVAQCVNVCGGRYSQNQCDATTLTYACVCLNGTEPDLSAFVNTLPFFECEATYSQCIDTNMNNLQGQMTCMNNRQCGNETATPLGVATSTMATASSSASGSGSATGSATASAASTSSHNVAVAAVTASSNGIFAALLFALWRLAL